jgi:hypothetical protein
VGLWTGLLALNKSSDVAPMKNTQNCGSHWSAFNEGGNTTTGYGAVNISRTLQLSLPIAE